MFILVCFVFWGFLTWMVIVLLPLSKKGWSRSNSIEQLHQCRSWIFLLPLFLPLRCNLLREVTFGLQWSWVECQPAPILYSTCTVTVQSLVTWIGVPLSQLSARLPASLALPCVFLGLAVNSEVEFWSLCSPASHSCGSYPRHLKF